MSKRIKNRGIVVVVVMLSFLFACNCDVKTTLAYSASITTSNSIVLNAALISNGTSIHAESINVQSDCRSGYNLTIAVPEGSDLYRYDNGNQAVNASFTAVDGVSALNSSNNTNKWGYTLTNDANASTVFYPLSSNESVLKTSTQTASASDINDTFSIYYGVKTDNTIEPGVYQMANNGSVVYYLTMDVTCTQYTVSFDPNGGTVTSGGNNPTQAIQQGELTNLNSAELLQAPTAASYTDADNNTINGDADKVWVFWGWNTKVDGTGDWYKDKEAVENLTAAGTTITLYAQWKQATLIDLAVGTQVGTEKVIDHNTMQDMSAGICYNSTAYSIDTSSDAYSPYNASTNPNGYHTVTLNDYRGKVTVGENLELPEQYNVSRLADGLCWMTTNLNLGRSGTDGPNGDGTVTLTSEDSDLANNATFALPAHSTTSSTANNTARIRITNNDGNNDNGVFYSWAAAVAGVVSNPTVSVCPKNWDLPNRAQYDNLQTKMDYKSGNSPTSLPGAFLLSGGFTNGATFYQTSYGHLWTTQPSTSAAYGARIESARVLTSLTSNTTYGGNKYYEKNVRCVASKGRATVNYDGNGTTEYPVTGSTSSQVNVEINSTNTRASSGFIRTGWIFKNWNTASDGSGVAIAASTALSALNIKPSDTITLYAQWTPVYKITYVNNCATYNTGCTTTTSNTTSIQNINLTSYPSGGTESGTLGAFDKFTQSGWKIKEWTTNADGTGTSYLISSSYTVPSGSAPGDGITLYAHWVPVYSIQYDGNGADNPDGMGTTNASGVKAVRHINVSGGDPVTFIASNFKRTGYGFVGWSTDPDAWTHFMDNDSTNDSVIYGPMETISAPADSGNNTSTMTVYAVWVEAEKDGNNNPIYLQDFTGSDCSALTGTEFDTNTGAISVGEVIALTDKRDNEVYAVAKLADDHCWMVENLRLESAGTLGNNINDSSVTNQSLAQGYGGITGRNGNFVGLANPESSSSWNSTASNSIYKSSASTPLDTYDPINGVLEDIGSLDNPIHRFPRYDNSPKSNLNGISHTRNHGNPSNNTGTFPGNLYSYGDLYTWSAAMANTSHYVGAREVNVAGEISETVGTSICPYGWRLPTGGSSTKEFAALAKAYGGTGVNQSGAVNSGDVMSNRLRTFPNNFVFSRSGADGRYWTTSSWNSSNGNVFFLNSTRLDPTEHWGKNSAYAVRCFMDES
ncbi:InlB B-repeat-containing protein [Candidatus Saccharibacteria bacterium]|nr:InlB B-repeat-containing protein [Candidatus Saccharibacteria bacterium]